MLHENPAQQVLLFVISFSVAMRFIFPFKKKNAVCYIIIYLFK